MKILLSDFENYVSPKIYARGEEYYRVGAVHDLCEEAGGEWWAYVEGTQDYRVNIGLNGDELEEWECDCPYDGDFCKHVVATLLKIREKKEVMEGIDVVVGKSGDMEKLLQQTDKAGLLNFVHTYAAEHPEFKAALTAWLAPSQSDERAIVKDQNSVAACFQVSGGRGAWYRYEPMMDWDEVNYKLDPFFKKAALLIRQGALEHASMIALRILEAVNENFDESDFRAEADVASICEEAAGLLLEVAEHPDMSEELRNRILIQMQEIAGFATFRENEFIDFDFYLLNIGLAGKSDAEILPLLDEWINRHEEYSKLDEVVIRKAEVLLRLGKEEDVRSFIRKYMHLMEVRNWEVERLIRLKQYEQALALLDEGMRSVQGRFHYGEEERGLKKKWEIYERMGDVQQLITVGKALFVLVGGSMEYYYKLKKYVSASSWNTFLKELMAQTVFYSSASCGDCPEADIYVAEKDYVQLLALLQRENDEHLVLLQKYANILEKVFPSEFIGLFRNGIFHYAERHLGREHYEYVAKLLESMAKYDPSGREVTLLVQELRVRFRRRPAMMEVLQQFK